MLELIGGIVVFTVAIGVLMWIWESIKRTFFQFHIYIVPDKQLFIFSRGNTRIVFDTLSYFKSTASFLDASVNDLYITKYAPNTTSESDYLALDKDSNLVAVIPVSILGGDDLAVHIGNEKKPKWMKFTEFQEKQFEILRNAK